MNGKLAKIWATCSLLFVQAYSEWMVYLLFENHLQWQLILINILAKHVDHCKFLFSGVMAARGILNNPAMYAGYDSTPLQCVVDWVWLLLELTLMSV